MTEEQKAKEHTELYYFGTNLDNAGHYLHGVGKNELYTPVLQYGRLPFNPEALPYDYKNGREWLPNGTVGFYRFLGFTILAIAGSCADKRPNSKSVFFIKTEYTYTKEQVKEFILSHDIAKRIIEKMPFEVRW
jgi:hypothetical protein